MPTCFEDRLSLSWFRQGRRISCPLITRCRRRFEHTHEIAGPNRPLTLDGSHIAASPYHNFFEPGMNWVQHVTWFPGGLKAGDHLTDFQPRSRLELLYAKTGDGQILADDPRPNGESFGSQFVENLQVQEAKCAVGTNVLVVSVSVADDARRSHEPFP